MALRPLLQAVAYQMLGNSADAEDMVQECFLRWERTDAAKVRSPKAFLTTIVTRLCLKHLQSARVQREKYFGSSVPECLEGEQVNDPADQARLADSLAVALLVVLKALSPLERAVFLLREVFDCDYGEIARIVGKNEENCRQILRRARERVARRQPRYEIMPQHEEQIVQRFLRAVAEENQRDLVELLSEDVVLVCDGANLDQPAPVSVRGLESAVPLVLKQFAGWLGQGALLRTICFQRRPVILAYRNGAAAGSMFLSVHGGQIRSLCVVTCPVRHRIEYILPDPEPVQPVRLQQVVVSIRVVGCHHDGWRKECSHCSPVKLRFGQELPHWCYEVAGILLVQTKVEGMAKARGPHEAMEECIEARMLPHRGRQWSTPGGGRQDGPRP